MRDRTADLLRAKQALSQLSYSPIVTAKPCYRASSLIKAQAGYAQ